MVLLSGMKRRVSGYEKGYLSTGLLDGAMHKSGLLGYPLKPYIDLVQHVLYGFADTTKPLHCSFQISALFFLLGCLVLAP